MWTINELEMSHHGRGKPKVERSNAEGTVRRLSPRQQEILDLARKGRTRKEIARILGISENTVSARRQQIMRKLNALNAPHAVDVYHEVYLRLWPVEEG